MNKKIILSILLVVFISGCANYYDETNNNLDEYIPTCKDWAREQIPDTLHLNGITEELYMIYVEYHGVLSVTLTDDTWKDGMQIIMKAINSTYAYSENIVATPFTCHKGEYTGENVNYLYCPYERLIYESEPITDEQGLILGRNYFVISDLVFNNTENPEMFEIIDYKFVNNICEKVI